LKCLSLLLAGRSVDSCQKVSIAGFYAFCPVCRTPFVIKEDLEKGAVIICPVCGARLEITALDPEVKVRKFPQSPIDEITERVDNFARLRSYVFNEEKQLFLDGLLAKKERFGDFYCPCRFDNIPENICPCQETRMTKKVREDGRCHCGLYNLTDP